MAEAKQNLPNIGFYDVVFAGDAPHKHLLIHSKCKAVIQANLSSKEYAEGQGRPPSIKFRKSLRCSKCHERLGRRFFKRTINGKMPTLWWHSDNRIVVGLDNRQEKKPSWWDSLESKKKSARGNKKGYADPQIAAFLSVLEKAAPKVKAVVEINEQQRKKDRYAALYSNYPVKSQEEANSPLDCSPTLVGMQMLPDFFAGAPRLRGHAIRAVFSSPLAGAEHQNLDYVFKQEMSRAQVQGIFDSWSAKIGSPVRPEHFMQTTRDLELGSLGQNPEPVVAQPPAAERVLVNLQKIQSPAPRRLRATFRSEGMFYGQDFAFHPDTPAERIQRIYDFWELELGRAVDPEYFIHVSKTMEIGFPSPPRKVDPITIFRQTPRTLSKIQKVLASYGCYKLVASFTNLHNRDFFHLEYVLRDNTPSAKAQQFYLWWEERIGQSFSIEEFVDITRGWEEGL